MERRKFTREFKLEAVRLIKERGVSYMQAAQDLGVHPTQLRNWVKAFADDPQRAFPGHGPAQCSVGTGECWLRPGLDPRPPAQNWCGSDDHWSSKTRSNNQEAAAPVTPAAIA